MLKRCTVCDESIDPSQAVPARHPILNVPVCQSCAKFCKEGFELKGEPTCSWCAGYRDSLDFETCLKCGRVFCASCVEANLGKDPFADKDLLAGQWACPLCNPAAQVAD